MGGLLSRSKGSQEGVTENGDLTADFMFYGAKTESTPHNAGKFDLSSRREILAKEGPKKEKKKPLSLYGSGDGMCNPAAGIWDCLPDADKGRYSTVGDEGEGEKKGGGDVIIDIDDNDAHNKKRGSAIEGTAPGDENKNRIIVSAAATTTGTAGFDRPPRTSSSSNAGAAAQVLQLARESTLSEQREHPEDIVLGFGGEEKTAQAQAQVQENEDRASTVAPVRSLRSAWGAVQGFFSSRGKEKAQGGTVLNKAGGGGKIGANNSSSSGKNNSSDGSNGSNNNGGSRIDFFKTGPFAIWNQEEEEGRAVVLDIDEEVEEKNNNNINAQQQSQQNNNPKRKSLDRLGGFDENGNDNNNTNSNGGKGRNEHDEWLKSFDTKHRPMEAVAASAAPSIYAVPLRPPEKLPLFPSRSTSSLYDASGIAAPSSNNNNGRGRMRFGMPSQNVEDLIVIAPSEEDMTPRTREEGSRTSLYREHANKSENATASRVRRSREYSDMDEEYAVPLSSTERGLNSARTTKSDASKGEQEGAQAVWNGSAIPKRGILHHSASTGDVLRTNSSNNNSTNINSNRSRPVSIPTSRSITPARTPRARSETESSTSGLDPAATVAKNRAIFEKNISSSKGNSVNSKNSTADVNSKNNNNNDSSNSEKNTNGVSFLTKQPSKSNLLSSSSNKEASGTSSNPSENSNGGCVLDQKGRPVSLLSLVGITRRPRVEKIVTTHLIEEPSYGTIQKLCNLLVSKGVPFDYAKQVAHMANAQHWPSDAKPGMIASPPPRGAAVKFKFDEHGMKLLDIKSDLMIRKLRGRLIGDINISTITEPDHPEYEGTFYAILFLPQENTKHVVQMENKFFIVLVRKRKRHETFQMIHSLEE